MRTVSEILDIIKEYKQLKTDAELARYFDVTRSTASSWRSRNNLPYEYIVTFCEHEGVNLSWLLTGQITVKHLDQDGRIATVSIDEPGGIVAEDQTAYALNIDDDKSQHNRGIILDMARRVARVINEGDLEKMTMLQLTLKILTPDKEE